MADAVATLNPSVVLAKIAKFFRVMEAEDVDWSCFQLPIDSLVARRNLAEFLKCGCPEMTEDVVSLPLVPNISTILTTHHSFYHQFFNLTLDFSSVPIPPHQPGFDRLIVVAQGLTPNKVYEVCQQYFPCWRYVDDLDKVLNWDSEERNPKDAPYAIWVRDRQEADEELKGLSANQMKVQGLTTETLTERLLHGLMYWSETKKHLDMDNITLCAGSRIRGGGVPYVHWGGHGGGVGVGSYRPGGSVSGLRSRQVVS